ncbi:MAG: putative toxin-antitoxin system toxin component, PIN family [Clostridia bacterium]|nr:MAG: putative toxin-antitoxin system toxin component, PIN family [Clostridia bacterium]
MGAKPKVVLDTNVLISALGWAGPERQVYELCLQGELELYICRPILEELMRVLDYPKFKFPGLHKVWFMEDLLRIAELVEVDVIPPVVKDDPADNYVLACAAAAPADYLITGDKHLLSLNTYGSIAICSAATFLQWYQERGAPS